MKIIQKIFFTLVLAGFAGAGTAQVVEDTITVEGICGMCKTRIEEAALAKGSSSWNGPMRIVNWLLPTAQIKLPSRRLKSELLLRVTQPPM